MSPYSPNSYSSSKSPVKQMKLRIDSYGLFDERSGYINCHRIYYGYFKTIGNIKIIRRINHQRAIGWIESELKNEIIKRHSKEYFKSRKMVADNYIYLLKNNLLIDVEDTGVVCVLYGSDGEQRAQSLLNKLKQFIKPATHSYINLVVEAGNDLRLREIKNKKPTLNLFENYNDDLLPLHKDILGKLRRKGSSGLVLFHGKPGTGKSTYLRYLVHKLKKKTVIFLPPKLAGNLDSPGIINLLLDNENAILVIEDAESLITSRDKGNDSSISMLLNLTDGMLGESLGTQVICTFNTIVGNVDKALLRKGRLIGLYEFDALCVPKSKTLLEKLDVFNFTVTEPMTLADIYNTKEQNFELKVSNHKAIGFSIHSNLHVKS